MTEAILTYPADYYKEAFSRKTSLMVEYKSNMLLYLKKSFPNEREDVLLGTMNNIIAEQYKPSTLKYLSAPSMCNIEGKSNDLLEMTNELNHDILSPYGATYCSVNTKKALFSEFIEDKQKERKIIKHEMFLCGARGDKAGEKMGNLNQMNVKIDINALSGVMLSNVTFRSAINYNAITATSRFSVMTAYSVVEMAVASNYYFNSEDAAINWIINLLRVYPGDARFSQCIEHYKITIPSTEKVLSTYSEQVNLYSGLSKCDNLKHLLYSLSSFEVAFVYYAVNLKRIFQENESFRPHFEKMVDIGNVPLFSGEVPKVAKLKDGLISTFAVVCLAKEIGKITLEDIDKDHPDLARLLYSTYLYLEEHLKYFDFLFEILIMLPIVPSDIALHKNMVRRTVLLSDTDSILFTNIDWIMWFSGNIHITDKSSRLNIAMITIISKYLEHVFAYMSASMNVDLINIKLISIKNEFMYDLFLKTPISKHYAGYVKYKEGILQDPYKFDLKGKNFKGSDLCKETTSYVKWFIKYIFDSFLKTYEIVPEDLITKAILLEQRIKHSINTGEVTFLAQRPINLSSNYKNPEGSNYLYYEMWQAVFAEKYGDLNLPQKTKELPISSVSVQNTEHLTHIKKLDKDIYDKFVVFISKYPKRVFSRVLIPMDIVIPSELRAIADYRKVCAANCYSMNLILNSFNIVNYPNGKRIVLFSDTYPELLQEITDEDRKRAIEEAEQYEEDLLEEDDDEDWIDQTWERDNDGEG